LLHHGQFFIFIFREVVLAENQLASQELLCSME